MTTDPLDLDVTKRERRVALEYASGLSHRDVADKLRISPATVRTHLSSVYRKLGVTNKVELHTVISGPAPKITRPWKPNIAVLPFAIRGPEWRDDFLATGLADAVTSALSRFRGLLVISHSSCLEFRGSERSPAAIARELRARYAVSGYMSRSGRKLRVTAELLDTSSGALLWARNFDTELGDLFIVQDELARDIAASVAPEIETSELEHIRGPMVSDPDAWELYCRALRQFWQGISSGNDEVKDLCRRAIDLDGHFAAPHSLLSRMHFYDVISARSDNPARSADLGIEHANRALQIDRRDEVAYTVLGYNLAHAQRFVEAFQAIEMGLAVNPSSAGLYNARATIATLSPDGDLEQAREDEWLALRLSPNDPIVWTFHATLGGIELIDEESGSVDAAIDSFRKAHLYPNSDWGVDFFLAVARLMQGRNETAVRHARKSKVTLGHLTEADINNAFGGFLVRSPRLKSLAQQVLQLVDNPELK